MIWGEHEYDLPRYESDEEAADLRWAARLPALALGAPALRALHLVLTVGVAERDLDQLWRALEALPNLASLALGWVFRAGEPKAHMGGRIADVLDAVQAGLSVSLTCRRMRRHTEHWDVEGW